MVSCEGVTGHQMACLEFLWWGGPSDRKAADFSMQGTGNDSKPNYRRLYIQTPKETQGKRKVYNNERVGTWNKSMDGGFLDLHI